MVGVPREVFMEKGFADHQKLFHRLVHKEPQEIVKIFLDLFQALPAPFLLCSADHEILLANREAENMLGEEVASSGCFCEWLQNRQNACVEEKCPLDKVLETGLPKSMYVSYEDTLGHTVHMDINAQPVFDADDQVSFVLALLIKEHSQNEFAERQQGELAILSELADFGNLKMALRNVLNIIATQSNISLASVRFLENGQLMDYAKRGLENGEIQGETRDQLSAFLEGMGLLLMQGDLKKFFHERYFSSYGSLLIEANPVLEERIPEAYSGGIQSPYPFHSLALIPIKEDENPMGLIQLMTLPQQTISSDDLHFFELISRHIASTFKRLRDAEALKESEEKHRALSQELALQKEEIRKKNEELQRSNRMKTEFLTNMSHELRTPLNSIIGFSELLERQLFGSLTSKQKEYVQDIRESGEHLLALLKDILDVSKIETGAVEVDWQKVFLSDLLKGTLRMFKERALEGRISLSLELPEDIGIVVMDGRKIKQVLFNLLSNALKFTPKGGSVILRAERVSDNLILSVEDTGIGIEEKDRDRVFKEFTQIDGSITRRHEGAGLGLALSKKLVELHGGTIWVTGEKGKGSTFSFQLPQAFVE